MVLKRSGLFAAKWKFRYIHLTFDSIVIETPDTTEKERIYSLKNAKVQEVYNKPDELGFPFEITLADKKKTLIFKCRTVEERSDWVSAMNLLRRPLLLARPFASGISSQVLNILYEDGFPTNLFLCTYMFFFLMSGKR